MDFRRASLHSSSLQEVSNALLLCMATCLLFACSSGGGGASASAGPPASPTGLSATAGDSAVEHTWDSNTEPDLAGYRVYRSTTSGVDYAEISSGLITGASYNDVGLTNGVTYFYVVCAEDTDGGLSDYSNEVEATPSGGGGDLTPPGAPTDLHASPGDSMVFLAWDANTEPDLAGYRVYRSLTSGVGHVEVSSGLLAVPFHTDRGLANGTTYYYVVRAEDSSGNLSGDSNEAVAAPAGGGSGSLAGKGGILRMPGDQGASWSYAVVHEESGAMYLSWSNGGSSAGGWGLVGLTEDLSVAWIQAFINSGIIGSPWLFMSNSGEMELLGMDTTVYGAGGVDKLLAKVNAAGQFVPGSQIAFGSEVDDSDMYIAPVWGYTTQPPGQESVFLLGGYRPTSNSPGAPNQGIVGELNSSTGAGWIRAFSLENSYLVPRQSQDGGCWVSQPYDDGTGQEIYLAGFSSNGDVLYQQSSSNDLNNAYLSFDTPIGNGRQLLGGRLWYSGIVDRGWICVLDESTGVAWNTQLSGHGDVSISGATLLPDGDVFLHGEITSGGMEHVLALRISSAGVIQWAKKIGGDRDYGLRQVLLLPDGTLSLLGWTGDLSWMWIARLTEDGQILWQRELRQSSSTYTYPIMHGSSGSRVLVMGKGLGSGTFGAEQVITGEAEWVEDAIAADLDGDGDQDVLSASRADDMVAWYENTDGQGTFGPQQVITITADAAKSICTADIDGDGDQDVLSSSVSDDKVAWYENTDGMGTFGAEQVITTDANGGGSVIVADLDGDGDQDLICSAFQGFGSSNNHADIVWFENLGNISGFFLGFGPLQTITSDLGLTYSIHTADLDRDGDPDLLSGSASDSMVAWFENQGGGTFGPKQVISTAVDWVQCVYAKDLDGDGDLDVLSASQLDDKIAWYENLDSRGTFGDQQVVTLEANLAKAVVAADIDGDGDEDILSAAGYGDKVSWYENTDGLGTFGPELVIRANAIGALSVCTADFDGDGDLDVLSASFYDDTVAWNRNEGIPLEPDAELDIWAIVFEPGGSIASQLQWSNTEGLTYLQGWRTDEEDPFILTMPVRSPSGNGGLDCLVAKWDKEFSFEWSRLFGGSEDEFWVSHQWLDSEEILLSGSTRSFDAIGTDAFILGLDKDGHTSQSCWERDVVPDTSLPIIAGSAVVSPVTLISSSLTFVPVDLLVPADNEVNSASHTLTPLPGEIMPTCPE
jgi:hypothetical protein